MFCLDHTIGSQKLTDISETDLRNIFQDTCKTLGIYRSKYTYINFSIAESLEKEEKEVKLQDVHEAYQLVLKIVTARKMFSQKLEKVRNKEESQVKIKVNKAARLFKKR